ncbi:hypothetical protein AXG93_829s1030 [Marchantia polymorpha subsp. ruderalis]|uniref:Methyltransferase type 11 domain-containing protein n=1 Tax=Marchantia polymorpha subsp. ruderalis TaxID=1480154 RepID=A0A176W370_MARPO|nr:hypothetical protein AXG93_829s1030 [Marchantia polymorpha subsp. ruderalis]
MMGLAGCELFRVLTTPVQFPCRTTVSATRALFAIPDREDDRRIRSLSALRDVHYYVCPALLSRVPAFTTGRRSFYTIKLTELDHKKLMPFLRYYRWERRRPVAMAGALSEVSPATIVGLSTALSFVLLRAFVYFRMEYIIASMLGRHVPRGGAKVVELDIREGRNMYYYPSDTVQVVAVSSNPNRTLLENQAIKAGVPIQIKLSGASTLGLPANTMDAVVSVKAFCNIPDAEVKNTLREAIKVLQPGKDLLAMCGNSFLEYLMTNLFLTVKTVTFEETSSTLLLFFVLVLHYWKGVLYLANFTPFIFVEPVGAKNPVVRAAQNGIQAIYNFTRSKRVVTRDLLQYIQEMDGLEEVEYEEIFGFFDPQLVGVAKKKPTDKVNLEKASQESPSVKRGFKKSKA